MLAGYAYSLLPVEQFAKGTALLKVCTLSATVAGDILSDVAIAVGGSSNERSILLLLAEITAASAAASLILTLILQWIAVKPSKAAQGKVDYVPLAKAVPISQDDSSVASLSANGCRKFIRHCVLTTRVIARDGFLAALVSYWIICGSVYNVISELFALSQRS